MAVAERVWFVVSLVTTPCLNPARVSLSEALRARPVNVVPFRTATVTWPRLTFAPAAPLAALASLAAGVVAAAGGATVLGFGAGLLSLPPRTNTPTRTAAMITAAIAASTPTIVRRERPPALGPPARLARAAPATVRGGIVACPPDARGGAEGGVEPPPTAAAVAGAGAGVGVGAP